MYPLAKSGVHSCYEYMSTLEKAERIGWIRQIVRFSKSGIAVYYSEDLDTGGRKTRTTRRRTYAFHANAIIELVSLHCSCEKSMRGRLGEFRVD